MGEKATGECGCAATGTFDRFVEVTWQLDWDGAQGGADSCEGYVILHVNHDQAGPDGYSLGVDSESYGFPQERGGAV